mgnify:CR=1 FL=1
MNRNQAICGVGAILDTYCQDCFLREFLRETYGKNEAQRFCLHECSVGEQLQKYGDFLSGERK